MISIRNLLIAASVLVFVHASLAGTEDRKPGRAGLMPPWKAYALMKQTQGRAVLIDIRGAEAYAKRHIEGSLNIQGFILPTRKFPDDWNLVLVCASLGMRDSIRAAEKLAKKGVKNLFVLDGGIDAWEGSGFPVVGDRKDQVHAIMPENLVWALSHGARVRMVDIRSTAEFNRAHVPASNHFQMAKANEVPAALRTFLSQIKAEDGVLFEKETGTLSPKERDMARVYARTEVVLIGGPDPKAETLTRLLRSEGYSNVRFLYGGFDGVRGLIKNNNSKPAANQA